MERKTVSRAVLTWTLMSVLALTFFSASVMAQAQIDILTNSGWLDSLGNYHVSGEVQNVGNTAATSIGVEATFYNSSNTVVATESTNTFLSILLAGRNSPFEVLLTDTVQAAKVDHYSLDVTFSPLLVSPPPEGLEILSDSSYTDILGMHVVGDIKNIEIDTATNVLVIATFYNSTGTVVATGSDYSEPGDVNAGDTASFDVLLAYANRVSLVASYVLTAQSDQFAVVPEFPSITVFPLFAVLTFLAVVAAKRRLR